MGGRITWDLRFVAESEVTSVFGRARAVALPYRWIEGSGVLATALAQGVPPVVTAVGTFPELCAAYDLGDPVPPDDPGALADALVRALTDPAARARAVAGMARARAELTWERTARMTLDLYERALAGASRGSRWKRLRPIGRRGRERSRGTLRDMRLRSGLLALVLVRPPRPALRRWLPRRAGTLAQTAGAGGCASMQVALGCTAAHGLDDARAVGAEPRRQVALRRLGDARNRDDVHRRLAQRTAAAAQPQRRLPDLDRSARLRRRARARGRFGHRRVARRPARLRRGGRRRAPSTSFARQPNGSLVQLTGIAGCVTTTPDARLRQRAGPGGRRRDRDLARRALRLRAVRPRRTPSRCSRATRRAGA